MFLLLLLLFGFFLCVCVFFFKRLQLIKNEVVSGIAHNINKDGEIEVLMEQNEAGEKEVRSFSVGEIFEKIVYY